jgi:ABC-type multidrug transport system fused ATPase/permease subunit
MLYGRISISMNSFKTLKKALVYLEPFRTIFFTVVLLVVLESAISTSSSYFLGIIINNLTGNNFDLAILFTIIYFFARVLPILFLRVRLFIETNHLDFRLANFFNLKATQQSLDLSLGQLKIQHSGFKQDLIEKGRGAVYYIFNIFSNRIIPSFTTIIISLAGFYLISEKFFYIAGVYSLFYFGWAAFMNKIMKKNLSKLIDFRKEKNKVFIDVLRNLFFIKFSGQKSYVLKQLGKFQDTWQKFGVKIWTSYHYKSIINDLMIFVFIGLILFIGLKDFQNGSLAVGMVVPLMVWSAQLSQSLGSLKRIQRGVLLAIADLEKMLEMLEQKTDIFAPEKPVRIKGFNRSLKFENVSFSYKDGKQGALTDVDLDIKVGEKVALVGRSGSGKSTLVSLILRLYDPNFGEIKVDDIDLKQIDVPDWHSLISYVPQDGDLIDMTIKENILLGAKDEAPDLHIEKALKQAEAYEFVKELPNGINTKVGERGVKLSGGQKQRICIARALIKNSPILILDEATSSLDSETEQFLNKNIWDILSDKTGIVIAHRLSTILDADKIVVVDDGKIIGVGKHEELLKTCKFYKTLVDAQNISF